MLEKKLGYNGTIHQLFIKFKKAYDSVGREEIVPLGGKYCTIFSLSLVYP
jgi:hypothetical protein